VHYGKVGAKGQNKTVKVKFWQSPDSVIKKELADAWKERFQELDIEDHVVLLVQYQIDGFSDENDIKKRYAVEDVLNESLGWTGNGICDGGSTEAAQWKFSHTWSMNTLLWKPL
jgi:hypothetical protein